MLYSPYYVMSLGSKCLLECIKKLETPFIGQTSSLYPATLVSLQYRIRIALQRLSDKQRGNVLFSAVRVTRGSGTPWRAVIRPGLLLINPSLSSLLTSLHTTVVCQKRLVCFGLVKGISCANMRISSSSLYA